MSETAPQSLASLVDQTASPAGGDSATATTQSAANPPMPSLSALVNNLADSSASGDASPSSQQNRPTSAAPTGQTAVTPQSGQSPLDPAFQATQTQQAQQAQEQARLRALLSTRGFDIPESYSTDDAIADLIAQQLDAAAAAEAQLEQLRAATQQTQAQAPAAPVTQQPATPASPESQIPADAILSAIANRFLTQDADGKWAPQHPSFAKHAEQYNATIQRQQQMKAELAVDPEAYIQRRIKEALESYSQQKPSAQTDELKQLLDSVKQQQVQAQISQIEAWGSQNQTRLFDSTGKPTAYYGLYNQFYTDLTKADPTFEQRPLERHNEVLKRIQQVEAAFLPTALAGLPGAQAQGGQAAQTQPPAKPTFLDAAARRNGTNRLSDYAGPARNQTSPQIPTGKGGLPSLHGIVNTLTDLGGN